MKHWKLGLALAALFAIPLVWAGQVPNPVNAPASVTTNAIAYWSGTQPQNNLSSIATANNAILATNGSGVPSLANPPFSDLSGNISTSQMNSGTGASASTYWRGDGTWATPSGGSGCTTANPTGTVGLATVNGLASTCMRSDAAPALSQSIAPTWTGQHQFNVVPIFTAGNSQTTSTGHVEGVIYSVSATQSTGGGTGEQTLATYSLAANSLDAAGRNLRIRAWFLHAANSDSVTFRLYFGAEVISSGAVAASGKTFLFQFDVLKTGSNAQNVVEYGESGGGSPVLIAPAYVAATETDTSAITIKATAQDGTSSAGDGSLVCFTVEFMN